MSETKIDETPNEVEEFERENVFANDEYEEDVDYMINYHDDLLGDELAAFETFDPLLFESAI